MDKQFKRDRYYMEIALNVAKGSTCSRLNVGAVIVDTSNRIVSTGYNGSPKGMPHCKHEPDSKERCWQAIHAETNAIIHCNRIDMIGATIYCTHQPCENCLNNIIQCGIKHVVYLNPYKNERSSKLMMQALVSGQGVYVTQLRGMK